MIAVIFELEPHAGLAQRYFEWADALKQSLMPLDGFISIERFESLSEPGRLLSLSFWRDEAAVARWRQVEAHRDTQQRGRAHIFSDYRLRVAAVVRDYGLNDRAQAPLDSRAVHG